MTCDDEKIITCIFRGDDTNTFGRKFIKVNPPKGIEPEEISKIIVQCGPVGYPVENPTFPFYVSFNKEQTKKLNRENCVSVMVFDRDGNCVTKASNLLVIARKQLVVECPEKKPIDPCDDCYDEEF